MTAPFFSIIIPVYNVAPYLRECLDSVLAQTFTDWEAICVDDGSTDGSGSILDEYAAKDKRFTVIHQPNAGVSAARNKGLDNIRGEYFGFIDPDDILKCDYIEHLLSLVKGKSNCIAAIGWSEFVDGTRDGLTLCSPKASHGVHRPNESGVLFHTGVLWNKIYPKSLVAAHPNIRFCEGLYIGEDVLFAVLIGHEADRIIVDTEYHGYCYRVRKASLCHGRSAREITLCYWEDAIALSQHPVAQADPQLIKEFLSFCVSGHLYAVKNLSDVLRVIDRMDNDGVGIWKNVIDLTDDTYDFQYEKMRPLLARKYARILLSGWPLVLKAMLVWAVQLHSRISNRLSRCFGRKI